MCLLPSIARGALLAIGSACLLFSVESAHGQWSIPEELQERAGVLSEEQREFITSGAILEFIPERQLEHELITRDADGLRALVSELMSLANEMGYDPDRDMGAAPLNLASKRFNAPIPTPAPLRDLEREPGPFSVHRYLFPRSGVPTFGGAEVAIWPEDLVAGNVDVAIVGVPTNSSSGRRDARNGPSEMRGLNTIAAPDGQSLLKPFETLSVVDYGDFSVDRMSTERTIVHVAAMVAETAGTGAIPMLVGGDTSMLYPGVTGAPAYTEMGALDCCISALTRTSSGRGTTRSPTGRRSLSFWTRESFGVVQPYRSDCADLSSMRRLCSGCAIKTCAITP